MMRGSHSVVNFPGLAMLFGGDFCAFVGVLWSSKVLMKPPGFAPLDNDILRRVIC